MNRTKMKKHYLKHISVLLSFSIVLTICVEMPFIQDYIAGKALIVILLFTALYYCLKLQENVRAYDQQNLEFDSLMDTVSCGIVTYALDDNLTILYANAGYYKLIGYSPAQVRQKFNNSGRNFIGAEKLLSKIIVSDTITPNIDNLTFDFTLKRTDGTFVWLRANCYRYHRSNNRYDTVSYLLLDITKSKMYQQKLLLEKERYHIATEMTNDVIFEYDIETDIIEHSAKYTELFGRQARCINFSKNIYKDNFVYRKDIDTIKKLINSFRSGEPKFSTELKLRNIEGSYAWFHINSQTIYNIRHEPIKVIGKIVNIDTQKKTLLSLEKKACKDPLTDLYNKAVTETMINSFLKKTPKSKAIHALMIIDIDDFKDINDTFGHLIGDEVLKTFSMQLQSLFGPNDVIGRIGGDEFVAFMHDIRSTKTVFRKANAISHTLRQNQYAGNKDCMVSASIGIAISPQNGATYKELLDAADHALYQIKSSGKDCFATANNTYQNS
ncbi:PAS domain S-box-containing protein/diguanylate cyclase (GGDEF) domain-containing protein [Propionispira arboris]|uniref:PAS domain S-box-containing protein/diguanylate cyclase (GGDEF) domain-containing protein n=2 Tax=Propionispira arboris TaxID=84035 RepID=A0A1H6ZN24_9FIRM|nr:PAS domain S-box-containing protein/diguanylate cyclase (GGDEF) domain-containing protein [Propionispira arboris]